MATNDDIERMRQDIVWLKDRSVILITQVDDVQQRLAAVEAIMEAHVELPAHTDAASRLSMLETDVANLRVTVEGHVTQLVNAIITKLTNTTGGPN